MTTKTCRHCGTEFKPATPRNIYCTGECRRVAGNARTRKRTKANLERTGRRGVITTEHQRRDDGDREKLAAVLKAHGLAAADVFPEEVKGLLRDYPKATPSSVEALSGNECRIVLAALAARG